MSRGAVRLALLLVMAGGVGACSPQSGSLAGNRTSLPSAPSMALSVGGEIPEPDKTLLVEPTPKTEAQRLLQQSLAGLNFCAGWKTIDGLDEPPAYDLAKQTAYAYTFHGSIAGIDLNARIPDIHAVRHREVPLPAEIKTAVASERAAIYAYEVRVGTAKAYEDQRRATTQQVDSYLDHAFQSLAASTEFIRADHLLEAFYLKNCVG